MKIAPGTLLVSTALLKGSLFEETVILLVECNEKGVIGFIINKLFPRKLNELVQFSSGSALNIFYGGPVDNEHLFFVHQHSEWIDESLPVSGKIGWGGNFEQALLYIREGFILEKEIKIFIGYSGWDVQQLKDEIAEGSWEVINAQESLTFTANPSMLWEMLYARRN
jgi:putative transcriptional regulator